MELHTRVYHTRVQRFDSGRAGSLDSISDTAMTATCDIAADNSTARPSSSSCDKSGGLDGRSVRRADSGHGDSCDDDDDDDSVFGDDDNLRFEQRMSEIRNVEYRLQTPSNDDEAYLCNKECYSAMVICLRAVEKNDPALLADVNPNLMVPRRYCMVRSSSLPIHPATSTTPATARGQHQSHTVVDQIDRLAPQFASPPKHQAPYDVNAESTGTQQCAVPVSQAGRVSADRPEGRLEGHNSAAREALIAVLDCSDYDAGVDTAPLTQVEPEMTSRRLQDNVFPLMPPHPPPLASEPLRNMEIETGELKRRSMSGTKVDEGSRHERRVRSDSDNTLTRSESKNSVLLDKILNAEEMKDCLSVTSELPAKKITRTHKRAHSDYNTNSRLGVRTVFDKNARLSSSAPRGSVHHRRRSLMEDGGRCVTPLTECYFPRPRQGQSLRSFLTSHDFHTCAELDKENAHFNISEALIAAIEQMKWAQVIRPATSDRSADDGEESDEEIQQLRQRIRIRKRERQGEKTRMTPFSDGRTTTTGTTSSTTDSEPEFWSANSDSSEVDVEIDVNDACDSSNLTSLQESGLTLSLGSLYSETELQRSNDDLERGKGDKFHDYSSAEGVAISLLSQFSERHLPKASDIEWLVSEEEAPQALLPLPDSLPVSPDEADERSMNRIGGSTRMRGNFEWAPPRAQIIFSIHPPPKIKLLVAKQNYRCAGCGTRVEQGYEKRFRYCEYLGKYFCQCCHVNQASVVPGHIVQKWDFTHYSVANFSYELLLRMYDDPLFNMADMNPSLYRKVKAFECIHDFRIQLFHIQTFLQTCRLAQRLYSDLQQCPSHWIREPDVYSLSDLIKVKNGELITCLRELVSDAVCHISSCELCQARGFICELCDHNCDILFPFELNRVIPCTECRACYHRACFVPDKCPRCARIRARRQQQKKSLPASPDNSDHDDDDVEQASQKADVASKNTDVRHRTENPCKRIQRAASDVRISVTASDVIAVAGSDVR